MVKQLIRKALQGDARSLKLILDLPSSSESEDPYAKAEVEATVKAFTAALNEVAAMKSARA